MNGEDFLSRRLQSICDEISTKTNSDPLTIVESLTNPDDDPNFLERANNLAQIVRILNEPELAKKICGVLTNLGYKGADLLMERVLYVATNTADPEIANDILDSLMSRKISKALTKHKNEFQNSVADGLCITAYANPSAVEVVADTAYSAKDNALTALMQYLHQLASDAPQDIPKIFENFNEDISFLNSINDLELSVVKALIENAGLAIQLDDKEALKYIKTVFRQEDVTKLLDNYEGALKKQMSRILGKAACKVPEQEATDSIIFFANQYQDNKLELTMAFLEMMLDRLSTSEPVVNTLYVASKHDGKKLEFIMQNLYKASDTQDDNVDVYVGRLAGALGLNSVIEVTKTRCGPDLESIVTGLNEIVRYTPGTNAIDEVAKATKNYQCTELDKVLEFLVNLSKSEKKGKYVELAAKAFDLPSVASRLHGKELIVLEFLIKTAGKTAYKSEKVATVPYLVDFYTRYKGNKLVAGLKSLSDVACETKSVIATKKAYNAAIQIGAQADDFLENVRKLAQDTKDKETIVLISDAVVKYSKEDLSQALSSIRTAFESIKAGRQKQKTETMRSLLAIGATGDLAKLTTASRGLTTVIEKTDDCNEAQKFIGLTDMYTDDILYNIIETIKIIPTTDKKDLSRLLDVFAQEQVANTFFSHRGPSLQNVIENVKKAVQFGEDAEAPYRVTRALNQKEVYDLKIKYKNEKKLKEIMAPLSYFAYLCNKEPELIKYVAESINKFQQSWAADATECLADVVEYVDDPDTIKPIVETILNYPGKDVRAYITSIRYIAKKLRKKDYIIEFSDLTQHHEGSELDEVLSKASEEVSRLDTNF